jgi:hypothetical protein
MTHSRLAHEYIGQKVVTHKGRGIVSSVLLDKTGRVPTFIRVKLDSGRAAMFSRGKVRPA